MNIKTLMRMSSYFLSTLPINRITLYPNATPPAGQSFLRAAFISKDANGYKWFSTLRLVTLLLKLPAWRKGKTSVR